MKKIATLTLLLNLGIAAIHAQDRTVKMMFSGIIQVTTLIAQPASNTDEESLEGHGTFGPYTYRELHTDPAAPQPSPTCSGPSQIYFPTVAGGGIFRFHEGSLLTVKVTGGGLCIDLAAGAAHLALTYQITGGTGRFHGASGSLTRTAIWTPVLFDSNNGVLMATDTGQFDGTVSGPGINGEGQDGR